MSKKSNERRCLTCHKLLIDEKLPFCYRCVLEGRDKAGNLLTIGGAVLSFISIGVFTANNNNQKPSNIVKKSKENDKDAGEEEEEEEDLDEQ